MGSQVIVAKDISAWESGRNAAQATIEWPLTIPNAMDKIKKLYSVRED
jgi:hypothetical protein